MTDTERTYTAKELAAAWGFSPNTIRKLFRDRDGVLKLRGERNVSLRIPASVAEEVRQEMAAR